MFVKKKVFAKKYQIVLKIKHRISAHTFFFKGTAVAQWLRCCATNRKVAGSILDVVNGIFH